MAKINLCTRYAIAFASAIFLASCNFHITSSFSRPSIIDTVSIPKIGSSDDTEIEDQTDDIIQEPAEVPDIRSEVAKTYYSQIGVVEKTGHNDGPQVKQFLASVGLPEGNPWCAAFVHAILEMCGIKTPITGYAPSAENKKKICYKNSRKYGPGPQQADVLTLYFKAKGRIGHTGFYDHMINSSVEAGVEGNTNHNKSAEGDGVYLVFRPMKTIHSISSWIN
jgi:hypothetical protein